MANEALKVYPRGQIAVGGGGQLRQVTNVSLRLGVNRKLKHSLAQSPSGYSEGVNDCAGSFNIEIPKKGPERDWFDLLKKGGELETRLEIPGVGVAVAAVLTGIDVSIPLDDAVSLGISFIGALIDAVPST